MATGFETERLYFEWLHESHFDDFCIHEMDPEVMKYIRKVSASPEEARKKFQEYHDYMAQFPDLGIWTIFEKETRSVVGMGVLIHLELKPEHGKYEVGYRFKRDSWGKGYATEATHGLLKYGFDVLEMDEIYGTTHPDNLVSQKVLIKVGLKDLGMTSLRGGSRFFCITRAEYQPRG